MLWTAIWPKNKSCDSDHVHLGDSYKLVIAVLILHMVNSYTLFEVSSCSTDISGGVILKNVSCDPDHAHFRDDFVSVGWDLLWSAYIPNLKSL